MRALVVGLGSIGRRHLENLRRLEPKAEIGVLRSGTTVRTDAAAPADYVVFDVDAALDHRPEVAVIANPASRHLRAAWELATQGVHLFIEKPIADRVDGVGQLIDECRARQLTLMVGYVLRFHPSLARLRSAVTSGDAGRLLSLRAEVGQYLPDWRPGADYRRSVTASAGLGGGALLELSHELDYLRWIGGEVKRVRAWAGRLSDLEMDVEDTAEVIMELECGAVATAHLDLVDRAPVRRCRGVGSEGTLELDLLTGQLRQYRAPETWLEVEPARTLDRNALFMAELRHFLDCARGREAPLVDGDDGLAALRIALAAKEAASTGRAVTLG